jgi:hypothetical protein
MGSLDRLIRTIVGVTLLILGPFSEILEITLLAEIVMTMVGIFALLSASMAYCFIYDIAGINTLGKKGD